MPLRILFADDSMTAQNMGKKILAEAGYEVIAVSNGAAAVKKIAEHKPDIIILDVYMPGYSGLEVCEKVRASIDTMKTPVLLTVGKMEPYKPEDANRVRADGVIIKPFEASDLLAIVKKLEERIVPPAIPPLVQQTIRLERPPDFSEFAVLSTGNSAPSSVATIARPAQDDLDENTVQPTVDVPDHMATVSAFSDLLGTDTVAPVEFSAPIAEQHPVKIASITSSADPSSTFTSIPEFETDSSFASVAEVAPSRREWEPPAHLHSEFAVAPEPETVLPPESALASESAEIEPVEVSGVLAEVSEFVIPESSLQAPSGVDHEEVRADGVYPDTQPIPVYTEPEAAATQDSRDASPDKFAARFNVEPNLDEFHLEPAATVTEDFAVHRDPAFEPTQLETQGEIQATRSQEPGLEPTIQEQPEIPMVADPNLITERAALESFPTTFGVQNPEEIPVGIASEFTDLESAQVGHSEAVQTENIENRDVEARSETSSALASADDDFEARVAAAMNVYAEPVDLQAEAVQAEVVRIEAGQVDAVRVEEATIEVAQNSQSGKTISASSAPEDDFEARVAAAMALYEEPQQVAAFAEERSASHETIEAASPAAIEPEPPHVEAETPHSFEYSPPVNEARAHTESEVASVPYVERASAFQSEAFAPVPPAHVYAEPEIVLEQNEQNIRSAPEIHAEAAAENPYGFHSGQFADKAPREAAPHLHVTARATTPDAVYVNASRPSASEAPQVGTEQIAANIEAEMPVEAVAAAATATGADSDAIAQVVHRVMERIKPELIAAIVRELNSRK